jgi:hypothetical protein
MVALSREEEVTNPKSEYLNPKQYRMTEIQMTKTCLEHCGLRLEDSTDFGDCLRLRLEKITNFEFAACALKTARASNFTC